MFMYQLLLVLAGLTGGAFSGVTSSGSFCVGMTSMIGLLCQRHQTATQSACSNGVRGFLCKFCYLLPLFAFLIRDFGSTLNCP